MTSTLTRRPVPTEPTPEVDPRIDDRRRAVTDEQRRRRRRVVGAVLASVLLVAAAVAAVRSPLLDVEQVRVAGTDRVDEVARAAGVAVGDPLIEVDASDARRRLMALPWVASARVHVDWPRQVRIRVVEEVPVAVLRAADGPARVVAAGGRVIGSVGDRGLDQDALDGMPRVRVQSSRSLGSTEPGDVLPEDLVRVVVVVEQLPAGLRDQLVDARLDRAGRITFELPEGGSVLFGPAEDVPAKLLSVSTVLGGRVELACLDVLDVREPLRPTISRVDGCDVPPPTTSAGTRSANTGGGGGGGR